MNVYSIELAIPGVIFDATDRLRVPAKNWQAARGIATEIADVTREHVLSVRRIYEKDMYTVMREVLNGTDGRR